MEVLPNNFGKQFKIRELVSLGENNDDIQLGPNRHVFNGIDEKSFFATVDNDAPMGIGSIDHPIFEWKIHHQPREFSSLLGFV
jgi:hypothetical protein